ncbi:MAG: helix-turn-helix transcriptional regulator [Parvibaculum sp.]
MQAERQQSAVGILIREWRIAKSKSQLDLALEADMSARHLSFLETGRALPGRDAVKNLAAALKLDTAQRSALLAAAGFAETTALDYNAPQMAPVRHAVELILQANEPYCAAAVDRHWNIVAANDTYRALTGAEENGKRSNMLHRFFEPGGMRDLVSNWDDAAYQMIQRLHREAIAELRQKQTGARDLLDDLMRQYDLPPRWQLLDISAPLAPALEIDLAVAGKPIRLFTTITTLGTPLDAVENEIRIEAFIPSDKESRENWLTHFGSDEPEQP